MRRGHGNNVGDDDDDDDTTLVPLRAEETCFEGVTKAQLQKLEELHLQRQILLFEKSRLENGFTLPPPPMFDDALPSYSQATQSCEGYKAVGVPNNGVPVTTLRSPLPPSPPSLPFTVDDDALSDMLKSSNFGSYSC